MPSCRLKIRLARNLHNQVRYEHPRQISRCPNGRLLIILQQSSTIPVWNGAAVIKTLLDLRDYQVC